MQTQYTNEYLHKAILFGPRACQYECQYPFHHGILTTTILVNFSQNKFPHGILTTTLLVDFSQRKKFLANQKDASSSTREHAIKLILYLQETTKTNVEIVRRTMMAEMVHRLPGSHASTVRANMEKNVIQRVLPWDPRMWK